MGKLDIDVSEVKKLIELVEKHNLEELTVREADLSVTIKGHSAAVPAAVVVQPTSPAASAEIDLAAEEAALAEQVAEAEEVAEAGIVDIVAAVVGVFYRSPAPDAPPFVEVGDVIEVGAEVGLIEAMKVFSPIPSEVAGEVVAIPAANGKLVQQGDVLVRIRTQEQA